MKVEVTKYSPDPNDPDIVNTKTIINGCHPTNNYIYIRSGADSSFPKHKAHMYLYNDEGNGSLPPEIALVEGEICFFCQNMSFINEIQQLIARPSLYAENFNDAFFVSQAKNLLSTLDGEHYNSFSILSPDQYNTKFHEDNFVYDSFNSTIKLYNNSKLTEYEIRWKYADSFSYTKQAPEVSNGTPTIQINLPFSMLKSEAVYKILNKEMFSSFSNEVYECINELGLNGVIKQFYIGDPSISGWYNPSIDTEKTISPNTSGCCYLTKDMVTTEPSSFWKNNNKCVLVFSPILFYMGKDKRKRLIYHELVHAIIGTDHAHDEYFWDTYEKITGVSRTFDSEYYDGCTERHDTNVWNSSHPSHEQTSNCIHKLHQHFKSLKRYGIKQI